MYIANKWSVSALLLSWSVVAYAQATAVAEFAADLTLYGWITWAFILIWAGVGSALRLASDHRTWMRDVRTAQAANSPVPVRATALDTLALFFVSMVSGLLAFTVVEAACQYFKYSPPSGIVGGIVLLAAFNNKRTIDAASAALFDALGWLARRGQRDQGGQP